LDPERGRQLSESLGVLLRDAALIEIVLYTAPDVVEIASNEEAREAASCDASERDRLSEVLDASLGAYASLNRVVSITYTDPVATSY
jgi:hypothetical protein